MLYYIINKYENIIGSILCSLIFFVLILQFVVVPAEAAPYPDSGFIYRNYKDDSFRNK